MRFELFLLAIALLALPCGYAAAHLADEFPQVTLQITINDEAVDLIVRIPAKDAKLGVFDGMSPVEMDKMEPEDLSALVGRVFAQRCEMTIDGVVVPPTVLGAVVKMSNSRLPARSFPEPQVLKQGTLKFFARYETKGSLNSISLDWSIFANEYDENNQPIHADEGLQVAAIVNAGDTQQIALLTPQQPSFTWQAQDTPALADLSVKTDVRRDMMYTPDLSVLILLVGGSVVFFIWRSKRRIHWAIVIVTVVLSAAALPFGTRLSTPTYINPPSDEERLAIFETLHRNIYRAFDYTDEGAVYDALSQSVRGDMLEAIYHDVYQSLIIREEEDALSKVVRVQMQKMKLLPIEDDADVVGELPYRVHCKWEVDGLVTHFGHTHARTNAFEAVYTVVAIGHNWRIIDAEILQQRRVDDGSQTAEDLFNKP
jgi:hypothetical protein